MAANSRATITVTGVSGAGQALTAAVFSDVTEFTFDPVNAMLRFTGEDGIVQNIAITAATTVTVTLSGANGDYTVVVS